MEKKRIKKDMKDADLKKIIFNSKETYFSFKAIVGGEGFNFQFLFYFSFIIFFTFIFFYDGNFFFGVEFF